MRLTSLCIISLTSVLLAGCQTAPPVKTTMLPEGAPAQVAMTAPDQTLLGLGRGMSDNSVDIYEPGVANLSVPAIETFTPRPSPVPENNGIIVRDPDVTVYSLDADPAAIATGVEPTALTPMPPEEPRPEPRRYAPELTPTAVNGAVMPGLQPPVVAQGSYASPFSPDGTLR